MAVLKALAAVLLAVVVETDGRIEPMSVWSPHLRMPLPIPAASLPHDQTPTVFHFSGRRRHHAVQVRQRAAEISDTLSAWWGDGVDRRRFT